MMMYDLLMPSELTAAIIDPPDLLALLSILFLGIVGLAVALTLLETARNLRETHPPGDETPNSFDVAKNGLIRSQEAKGGRNHEGYRKSTSPSD
jgi:hypothetical protein